MEVQMLLFQFSEQDAFLRSVMILIEIDGET